MARPVVKQTRGPTSQRPATGRIMPAAEYAELFAGDRDRQNDSGRRVDRLPSLHEEARLHGYRQGLRSVMTDLTAILVELRTCREDRAAWLQSFVLAVLHKILGEHDASSLVPAIARQAIQQCDRSLETVAIHVHPQVAADTAAHIDKAAAGKKRNGLCVDIVSDYRLSETDCELHTAFGIIDAGLDTQLEALAHALAAESSAPRHDGQ